MNYKLLEEYQQILIVNFYTYKSGNSNITQRYVIPYYYVQGVKDNIGIKVPTPNSGY